jgi:hypothetical protein
LATEKALRFSHNFSVLHINLAPCVGAIFSSTKRKAIERCEDHCMILSRRSPDGSAHRQLRYLGSAIPN